MRTIGDRVRELRHARGLSQQALAGEGISAGYVSLIESGKRTPSAAIAEKLAERLGVPVSRLIGQLGTAATENARLEVNFARLSLANGNPDEAISCLGKISLDELDSETACDAALVLAESLQETGRLDRAVGVLESLVDRCRREGSWMTLAVAATVLSVMYIESGDIARSVETAEAALADVETAELTGSDEHMRLSSVFISSLIERGDLAYATLRVEELIEVAERMGTPRARGSVYWNAAAVAQERGRVGDALKLTDRAVALLGDQEASRDLPRLRIHFAWVLLHQTQPQVEPALDQLDRASLDPALSGAMLDLGLASTLRGRAHLLRGDVDEAAVEAADALQMLGPSEHVERVSALLLLGDVGTAQLDIDLAGEALREARDVLGRMKPARRTARLWRELADSLREFGDLHGAVDAYDRSLQMLGVAARPGTTKRDSSTARAAFLAAR